ncbi:MAG TPA: sulfatase-like hydrolase/transferase [Myxococcota bacterium]|nr:sulfatase-like hydrolase/transferase [Myxococcota bacterium]
MTPARRAGVGPLGAATIAVVFGLGWYAVECVAMIAADPHFGSAEITRRAFRFAGWQALAFAAIGAPAAVAAAVRRVPAAAVMWWSLFGAICTFVGLRVVEGAMHRGGPSLAAARGAGAIVLAAAFVAALAALGRALPARARRAWPWAASAAAGVVAIGFLREAGPELGRGEIGAAAAARHLVGAHLALGLAIAGGACALAARRRPGPALAAALAVLCASAAARAGAADRPDVYVFLLDTLRRDHLDGAADGAGPTPALARSAGEFVRFASAWSPSTRTRRSMPGILASLSVRVAGSPLAPEAVTLAERLKDAGYATFGVSANPVVSAEFGLDQGFDSLTGLANAPDFLIVPVLRLVSLALPARSYQLGVASADLFYPPIGQLRRRALAFVDGAPGPRLVYAQTMDVHGPYLPPHRFLPPDYHPADFASYYAFQAISGTPAIGAPEWAPRIANLHQRYAAGVRHTDEELAGWIDDLRARGLWDEAIVWILSDHGEAFGEHGFAGHGHAYVGTPVVSVPLWLKLPRSWGVAPREIDATVSTYDVLPTTLGLLGLPPVAPVFGEDLAPLVRGAAPEPGRTVVIETDDGPAAALYSAVRGTWKLDAHFDGAGALDRRALFDLASDPGETRDVSAAHPDVAAALEHAIRERRRTEEELAFARRSGPLDATTRERLKALGYLDE